MILILYLICLVAIVYLLLIHPQRKRKKAQKQMAESLKLGSRVMTAGGFYGEVRQISEKTVILSGKENSLLEFDKAAIAKVMN